MRDEMAVSGVSQEGVVFWIWFASSAIAIGSLLRASTMPLWSFILILNYHQSDIYHRI